MRRPHSFLLAAVICGLAIGGSLPQVSAARQIRIELSQGAPEAQQDGWMGYVPQVDPSNSGYTTWWSRDDAMSLADRLAAAGVPLAGSDEDRPVFLFKFENGRITQAHVTHADSQMKFGPDRVLRRFGSVPEAESAAFIRNAYTAGGDHGLLFMLGRHRSIRDVEPFLTRIATGSGDIEDRKAALYGLGAFASPGARETLLAFIRGRSS